MGINKKERFKSLLETYSGLPKEIYVLFIARVINCIGNFVYPFMTFFLKDRLNMSPKQIGVFITITAVCGGIGALAGGKLADHAGRKRTIVISQGLAAFSLILCGILNNPHFIIWLLILSGIFNGAAQPANSAMLADVTNKQNRKAAFSLLYLGINVGFAIGPLIAGLLYNDHMRILFIGDGITTIISLILVVLYVKESIPEKQQMEIVSNDDEKGEEGSTILALIKRPNLLIFTLISIVYSFIYAQAGYIIPLQVNDIFGSMASKKLYGYLMTVNALTVIFFTTVITHITKKNKSVFNIALAGVFYAVGFGMLSVIKAYPLFIVSTAVWTVGEILCSTNSGVYIANHSPMSHRGRFNALIPIISGAGYAIAPYIMGGILENYGFTLSWTLVLGLAVLSGISMYGLYISEKRK
ncbi:MDR family MFS transporter [Haloimpatiens massiliensis]|uniref:MDR family MFS transporter n=1 Tax=Haloimpatiens massiliensis TaxID=1658110 RepID=UPI001FA84B17|nr:MFS transporter [Haloimpatiens massiliensis]